MVPNRKFCLSIFSLVLAYTTVSPCFAQSYGDAFGSSAASRAVPVEDESYQISNPGSPMLITPESGHVRTPTVAIPAMPSMPSEPAPILQGASCGTIGPQGGDATSIMGVNTAAAALTPPPRELPFVTIFLFATMLISAIFWCLKCAFKQRKTPMWVLGVIAACLFAIAGLAWSGKREPQGNIVVSTGYGPVTDSSGTAIAVDTPPELNESADSNSAASSATVTGGTLIIQDYHAVDASHY